MCKDQQRFFNALRFVPNLTLRYGRFQKIRRQGQETQCPNCSHKIRLPDSTAFVEKGVDVMLSTDLLIHAMKNHYDAAVLVSSDADYKAAIETVKLEMGKTVELRQVEGAKAYALITACSAYIPITADTIRSCLRTPDISSRPDV